MIFRRRKHNDDEHRPPLASGPEVLRDRVDAWRAGLPAYLPTDDLDFCAPDMNRTQPLPTIIGPPVRATYWPPDEDVIEPLYRPLHAAKDQPWY